MELELVEHVGCSWRSESREAFAGREDFAFSAAWHDAHGEEFTKCGSWLCVCGATDSRGGSWETCDSAGRVIEPAADWLGHVKCSRCGRVYDHEGLVIGRPAA
jgi:hypothetical protein